MNPLITAAPITTTPITDADRPAGGGRCPCHEAADCPDQATVAVTVGELARLGELLSDVDAFLRCGNGAAELLADFYAGRGDPHPGFAASNLIDAVCFTVPGLRRHVEAGGHQAGGDQ